MYEQIKGIIPPVSIIFDEQGQFDKKGMEIVIDFLIESGVHGLFFLGSGGEFSQMTYEQKQEVTKHTVEYVNKRVPVLIGTGSTSSAEAISLSQYSEQCGADGVVAINPYYWKITEENLFKYYSDIAGSISIPLILYNFPELTGQSLSPEFVLRLVDKNKNIIGIKETIDSIGHINSMITTVKSKHPDFKVFAGFDNHLFNTLALGGDGAICASVNFAPNLSLGIYKAFQDNKIEESIELHKRISNLPTLYSLDSPFINVVKEAMKLTGLDISSAVLPPANKLSDEKIKKVKEILVENQIINN